MTFIYSKTLKNSEFYRAFIILITILVISLIRLQGLSYDYDEFFNLQIPKNFAINGHYATYYDLEYHLFDPMITTGPSVLLPIAMIFKMSGNYLIARYIMLGFFIMVCIFIYIVSKNFFGEKLAILSIFSLLFIPLSNSVKVLGEIPSTLYFLIGIYFLIIIEKKIDNKLFYYILSGFFLALSVLSKLVFIIVLFPIFLFLMLHKEKWKTKIIFPISFISTLFAWEICQIKVLGINDYVDLKIQIYRVSFIQGAGVIPIQSKIIDKIHLLRDVFGINGDTVIVILIIFTTFCAIIFRDF